MASILSTRSLGSVGIAGLLALAACSSGAMPGEAIGSANQAVSADAGLITISGHITDSSGNSVGVNVQVSLTGSSQAVTFSNLYTGFYSLTVKPGSYSLAASGGCLAFAPSVVNLNNLTASTTVNFTGSGTDGITNCEPASSSGATSGSLTVSGVVTSGGQRVGGAKVSLNGSTQGFRYADETGAYSFSVNPGSYSVSVAQGCNSYSPNVVNLNSLAKSQVVNFAGSGNCPPAPLSLCPVLDTDFQLSSFGDVCSPTITSNACLDRFNVWDSGIFLNLAFLGTDCRFGNLGAAISSNFTNDTAIFQYFGQLTDFILYSLGCPYVGTQIGPLTDGLVPSNLASMGIHLTTADLQALSDDYVSAIQLTLSQNGSPALTSAQLSALQTELNYLQANVPGTIKSSNYTFSTCGQ
jgi:hypothetical protein